MVFDQALCELSKGIERIGAERIDIFAFKGGIEEGDKFVGEFGNEDVFKVIFACGFVGLVDERRYAPLAIFKDGSREGFEIIVGIGFKVFVGDEVGEVLVFFADLNDATPGGEIGLGGVTEKSGGSGVAKYGLDPSNEEVSRRSNEAAVNVANEHGSEIGFVPQFTKGAENDRAVIFKDAAISDSQEIADRTTAYEDVIANELAD